MFSLEGTLHAIGKSAPRSNASKGHKLALQIIREEFPHTVVKQEVAIKVSDMDKAKQFLDLYLPHHSIVFEIHGKQHDTFIPHFHKTKRTFIKAQAKDRQKKLWCEVNNIELVELSYKESEDEWRRKIRRAIKPEV